MKKKIRIMEFRGTYKGGGGPDKTILLSAEKHDKEEFFVLVTYLRQPDDDEFQIGQMAENRGIDYVEVIDRNLLDLKCVKELNALVKKHRIDIIHAHDDKTSLYGVFLKILNPKVRIMYTCHLYKIYTLKDLGSRAGLLKAWVRRKISLNLMKFYVSPILAVSGATKKMLVDDGLKSGHIRVLLNAIDHNYWKNDRKGSTFRQENNVDDETFIVGLIGRLGYDKDLPTFLKVAQKVLARYPETLFFLIGEGLGREQSVLETLCRDMGIQNSVIFTGFRSDLLNIYSALDLFLMTSTAEGLPNTVLEAMSTAIPVVSTAVDGVPELVEDGKTGFLCSVKDVDGLAEKVILLIKDSGLRKKLSQNGRKKIEDEFSFEKRLEIIEGYYRSLCH